MPDPSLSYAERLAKIQHEYPKAYHLWTEEDERSLLQNYQQGERIEQLAKQLQRQPGAIRSRLRKIDKRGCSPIDIENEITVSSQYN